MNDETPTGVVVTVGLIWAALLLGYLFTQSWEKVFLGVGILLGLGVLASVVFILAVLILAPSVEAVPLRDGIIKLDERLDEIVQKIKADERHFDKCRDSLDCLEAAIKELQKVIKEDSKTMANGSVNEAAAQIIEQI